jgi:hypothetical protein
MVIRAEAASVATANAARIRPYDSKRRMQSEHAWRAVHRALARIPKEDADQAREAQLAPF